MHTDTPTANPRPPLPDYLQPAYAWTWAAGELDLLASLRGEALTDYLRASAANAYEHGERDVHVGYLRDLHAWLRWE